jgi:hypothetical protein
VRYTAGMPAVKTAISLPEDIFRQVDEAAAKQGLSRSAVVLAALEKYLFDLETERLRAAWAAIPAEDFELTDEERADLEWDLREAMKRLDEEDGGWPEFNA